MKDTFYLNISTTDALGIGLFKYSLYPQEKFIITNSTLAHILGHASKSDFKKLLGTPYLSTQLIKTSSCRRCVKKAS